MMGSFGSLMIINVVLSLGTAPLLLWMPLIGIALQDRIEDRFKVTLGWKIRRILGVIGTICFLVNMTRALFFGVVPPDVCTGESDEPFCSGKFVYLGFIMLIPIGCFIAEAIRQEHRKP